MSAALDTGLPAPPAIRPTPVVRRPVGDLIRAGTFTRVDWLRALPDQALESADFPPRRVIFSKGDPGDRLYIIGSGKVKLGWSSRSSRRESLLTVVGPSDIFGVVSMFDHGQRTATATAVTEVTAYIMGRAALRTWIGERPEIAEHLLRLVARRTRQADTALSDRVFTDVAGRVAKALLVLADQFGSRQDGQIHVTHDLTQEEIAQLVGASRETVNRVLGDFVGRGWLRLEDRSVTIREPARLARRAGVARVAPPDPTLPR
jgi:CRP/FNR family cyclic AMP-dependent transcriptional regulator